MIRPIAGQGLDGINIIGLQGSTQVVLTMLDIAEGLFSTGKLDLEVHDVVVSLHSVTPHSTC